MKKGTTYTDPGKNSFLVTTEEDSHKDLGISRGWKMDALVSIAQELAVTNHLHELLTTYDDEDPEFDEVKYQKIAELLNKTVEERREKMRRLEGWSKIHCVVKHLLLAWETDMEVYQATLSSEDAKQIDKTTQRLALAVSLYLGLDPTDCLRCLQDLLYEKSK